MAAASLGSALFAAREAAGRTLDEVSAATRLRPQLLRDLEADRLEACGGPVYARAHVSAVCRALGLDPSPYLVLLARQSGGSFSDAPVHLPVAAPPERRGPHWVAAGVVAVLVLLTLLVIGLVDGA